MSLLTTAGPTSQSGNTLHWWQLSYMELPVTTVNCNKMARVAGVEERPLIWYQKGRGSASTAISWTNQPHHPPQHQNASPESAPLRAQQQPFPIPPQIPFFRLGGTYKLQQSRQPGCSHVQERKQRSPRSCISMGVSMPCAFMPQDSPQRSFLPCLLWSWKGLKRFKKTSRPTKEYKGVDFQWQSKTTALFCDSLYSQGQSCSWSLTWRRKDRRINIMI